MIEADIGFASKRTWIFRISIFPFPDGWNPAAAVRASSTLSPTAPPPEVCTTARMVAAGPLPPFFLSFFFLLSPPSFPILSGYIWWTRESPAAASLLAVEVVTVGSASPSAGAEGWEGGALPSWPHARISFMRWPCRMRPMSRFLVAAPLPASVLARCHGVAASDPRLVKLNTALPYGAGAMAG